MIDRPIWRERVENAWRAAPIVWLSGVRRSGKTTLARSLAPGETLYLNCDLPSVGELLRDPALFYQSCRYSRLIFDEIHQLADPTRVLKIAADEFPHLRILATGSSTLAAGSQFRDTLTGRKRAVHLLPVLWSELPQFGVNPIDRLHRGGLPQALLAEEKDPAMYREWLASFFARDIQQLFAFRDVQRFSAVFEYLLRQSGGQFEISTTATALGVTRPTIESHLRALEATHAITLVRPFHGGGRKEIVKQPKTYGFDTGFVSFVRGWEPLRPDDFGPLWEHVVLEQLQAAYPDQPIQYWRDQQGREVDFVIARGRQGVDAYECKWAPSTFDGSALQVFRGYYPEGRNYLLTPGAAIPYVRRAGPLEITVCSPSELGPAGYEPDIAFDRDT